MIGAYGVYCLYASAAALRDRAGAHASLGRGGGLFPAAGVIAAAFGVIGFFFVPTLAHDFGYPGAAAGLIGISMPVAAALLSGRAWTLTRLTGASGIGEVIARHYGSTLAAVVAGLVNAAALACLALIFALASGLLVTLTGGAMSEAAALWFVALFAALTAVPAGLRAGGSLAALHVALVGVGAIVAVAALIAQMGGIGGALDALARVGDARAWGTTGGRGGGDYPAALAVAGADQSTQLLLGHLYAGGALLALVWLPWVAALPDPRPLARAYTWGGAVIGTALMMTVAYIGGLAQSSPDIVAIVGSPMETSTVFRAAVGLGCLAAAHAFALALISGAVVAARPLWSSRRNPNDGARALALSQLHALTIVVGATLLVAYVDPRELGAEWTTLASLAVFAAIPMACACWFPRTTTTAILFGLATGIVVEIATVPLLGLPAAIAATVLATFIRRRDRRLQIRLDARRRLSEILGPSPDERGRVAVVLVAALIWIFFAIGPGVVVGNDVFGDPNVPSTWKYPLPSIAVWQIVAWLSGVAVVWFLVRTPGLGPLTRAHIEEITEAARKDRQAAGR